jgi:hypothetical protein
VATEPTPSGGPAVSTEQARPADLAAFMDALWDGDDAGLEAAIGALLLRVVGPEDWAEAGSYADQHVGDLFNSIAAEVWQRGCEVIGCAADQRAQAVACPTCGAQPGTVCAENEGYCHAERLGVVPEA